MSVMSAEPVQPQAGEAMLRVLWMDNTVLDYVVTDSTMISGVIQLEGRVRGEHPKTTRVINIPIANVRWYGTPGEKIDR